MAESVSDQNVEDMLSSVRRLISSELPRNKRPGHGEGGRALVLTEAQRVEPKPPIQSQRGLTLEERIAELEAAVDGQSNDWEPDGSEDQEVHRPDRIVYRPSRPRDEGTSQRPLRLSEIALIETGPAHDDDHPVETEEASLPDAEVPSFQHEDPPATDAKPADDPVADPSPRSMRAEVAPPAALSGDPFADAIARDVAAVVAEMAQATLAAEKDFDSALAEAVPDPSEKTPLDKASSPEATPSSDLTASPSETPADPVGEDKHEPSLEEPESGVSVESIPEAQATGTDDDAPVTSGLEIGARTAVDRLSGRGDITEPLPAHVARSSPQQDAASHDPVNEDDAETDNLLRLSPDQLRLLVSSMIRKELQGELGERITRNVRKMVRQEVHRALSVRDLE